jgi:hypothetical protein
MALRLLLSEEDLIGRRLLCEVRCCLIRRLEKVCNELNGGSVAGKGKCFAIVGDMAVKEAVVRTVDESLRYCEFLLLIQISQRIDCLEASMLSFSIMYGVS